MGRMSFMRLFILHLVYGLEKEYAEESSKNQAGFRDRTSMPPVKVPSAGASEGHQEESSMLNMQSKRKVFHL